MRQMNLQAQKMLINIVGRAKKQSLGENKPNSDNGLQQRSSGILCSINNKNSIDMTFNNKILKERRLHPRAIVLWNTVVKITPQKKKGVDNISIIAVLRDISLSKNYCNGFGFECKKTDAEKIEHKEKATILIMAEINRIVHEIEIPVVIIKERGNKSLGAEMDKEFEKSKERHPLLESWIKELHKEKKIVLPEQVSSIFDYINRKEFRSVQIGSVAKKIVKKLPLEKIPNLDYASVVVKLIRFLRVDYDFKGGVLRKDFLRTCFKKKASSELDCEDKKKGILHELAEKKALKIMGKERFKDWLERSYNPWAKT